MSNKTALFIILSYFIVALGFFTIGYSVGYINGNAEARVKFKLEFCETVFTQTQDYIKCCRNPISDSIEKLGENK